MLYPIPELSSNSPLTAPGTDSSVLPAKPTCLPHASLPSEHSCTHPAPKVSLAEEILPPQAESDTLQFQYFREDCAFSSPFWKDEGSASQFTFDPPGSRKMLPPRDREMPIDQKSLNQCSLNYICEKLEHLQSAENEDSLRNLSMPCLYAGDIASSFVPHTLFRSRPKTGWSFMLRIPEKKNMMSSRQWGPIFLKVLPGGIFLT